MAKSDFGGVRAAVIGTGFIAKVHAEALRRLGVQVAGVLSRDIARARAFAPGARAFNALGELCADESIDAVHVTSPNFLHAEHCLALLRARKHVICEKPLAIDVEQGANVVKEAEGAHVVNAVCFNLRYYPVLREARKLVLSGEVGKPRFVTGHYFQDWLLEERDWNWRVDPSQGGRLRAVSDIGSHWLDLACYVAGVKVEEVFADLCTFVPIRRRAVGGTETFAAGGSTEGTEAVEVRNEDAAVLLLKFTEGARGCLAVSQVSPGHKNDPRIEIAGSRASVAWEGRSPERLWVGYRGRRNEELVRDPAIMSEEGRAASLYPGGHAEGFGETFRALFSDVYADILKGGPSSDPPYPTLADGLAELLVEEAVAISHRKKSWQSVGKELEA